MLMVTLVACGSGDHDEPKRSAEEFEKPNVDQAATIAALPENARNGLFFRAIRDAGHSCQDILSAEAKQASDRGAEWVVKCEDNIPHLITIPPQGDAFVTSRTTTK